jgi:hypothetical protein
MRLMFNGRFATGLALISMSGQHGLRVNLVSTLARLLPNGLLSAYKTNAGDRLWIITEADRSVTTLLLPEEY